MNQTTPAVYAWNAILDCIPWTIVIINCNYNLYTTTNAIQFFDYMYTYQLCVFGYYVT